MTELRALLGRIRRRWFVSVAARTMSRVALAWAALILAVAFGDRAVPSTDQTVLARAAGLAIALAAVAALALWLMRRRPDDRRVARFVEERCPELDDTIVTAVDLSTRAEQPPFAPLVVDAAVARLRALDVARVVPRAELRRRVLRLAISGACLLLAVLVAWPFGTRVAELARVRYVPSSIRVAVAPGNVRIPVGQPLRIVARLGTGGRAFSHVTPELAMASGGRVLTMPMERAADGFEVRIRSVDGSFAYRVRAGGALSDSYAVTALVPPHVQRIDVHYDYPAFTRLAPRDETDGGDIYAPSGTRVRLRVRTDKPVASGRLTMSEGRGAVALAPAGDRLLETTLALADDGAYRVSLADGDGLTSEGTEYFIRIVADRPADVHITRPNGDQQITPLEEIAVEAKADDDFGIAAFDLVYSVGGGPETIVPFTTVSGTALARLGSRLMAAEDLHVGPGDVIAYYARARDVPHGKPSTLSRSEIYFLEVKPFNEEYVLAQSQAMTAAAGTQIESLIAAEKEIISATWNLERRSSAGTSERDVKSVADAQAELKARTQQAASVLRGSRRRGDEPPQSRIDRQPPPRAASGEPVSEAIGAMAKAIERLETRNTTGAIPHEMSALNALLRAQAEVRRRQISQQTNGSTSFGNGRQGQDISNLFDRELKRQQRTNYEQRAQVEAPQQEPDDRALDRIRDLARRQEDLGRRLSEASRLSEEERKRELEKLAREEEELRKQLEEGSRSSTGAGRSTGSGSQGSTSADAGEGAQRALEQMQRAMSEMRRNDPAAAAARGGAAAQQLRDLESRLRGGSPGPRKRELGDLQLESQQLAEAQRRLANEADRAAKDGSAAGQDARRRAAAEQEQLAQRADALRDAAKQLGSDRAATMADRSAATGAARDLESQRVGERMRGAADGLRKGTNAADAAAQARRLADALDEVARRAGGAQAGGATGETQRLADQLDQIREARDRLARLQQQIRDAQRQQGRGVQPGRGRAGREGRDGSRGQNGSRGDGQGGEVSALQQQYARELQRTQDLLNRVERGTPDSSRGTSTPEEHEWSRSAPGTESWKQDFGEWKTLSDDVTRSLERSEAAVAARLAAARATDRLHAGGSDRVPEAYRQRVAKYFELLAQTGRGAPAGGGRR